MFGTTVGKYFAFAISYKNKKVINFILRAFIFELQKNTDQWSPLLARDKNFKANMQYINTGEYKSR